MDHLPEDIEGLNFDQERIIEGALGLNRHKTTEIMSKIVGVVIVHMNTVLNDDTLDNLKQIGFSRIPISYSANQKSVFGIMLMKSLVGYTVRNETIKEAIINKRISVRVPLFFTE
jgi:CBS domain containing-hemolysin-like protein